MFILSHVDLSFTILHQRTFFIRSILLSPIFSYYLYSWEMFYGESSWCIFSNAIFNDNVTKVITVQLIPQRFSAHSSEQCTLRNARRMNRLLLIDSVDWRPIERQSVSSSSGIAGYDLFPLEHIISSLRLRALYAESKSITYVIRRCNARIARIHERARVLIVIEYRWIMEGKRTMYRRNRQR